ncbi:hypothetical protein HY612_01885 [Candidatus Roizmanbacteria bacterium]|nr:hypothetical protein [Candidatus Roizmanbacteria bacterium]
MSLGWRYLYQLIAANIVMIFVLAFKFNSLPPQIPLFYSKSLGEDQLADTWFILILPLFMNLLFFLNNFFYRRFYRNNIFVKKIFHYLNLLIIVSFTLIFAKIIFLIT